MNIKFSALAAGLVFAVSANAIEMTDYKLTESFYDESYVGMNFDLKDGNQDQTSYNGIFTGDYKAKYNSLPNAWDVNVNGKANISRGGSDGDSSEDNYVINASGHYDKYLESYENVFLYGSGEVGFRKLTGVDKANDPFLKIGVGAGYGRMYNATPLAKALRIAEDLRDYGIISELSDDALLKLASVIDRESEFRSKHGFIEYKKYWFEAMEEALKSAGAMKDDTLGAFGIVRIDEILFVERVSPRYHGWLVRAGVGQILSNYDGKSTDPTLDIMFEYGRPIGYMAQFYNVAKYSTLLSDDIGHTFTNNMSYTYEISNAIDWENSWNFNYNKSSDTNIEDIYTNRLSSTFRFYVANRLSLDATLALTSVEDDINDNGNDDLETRFNFGVTYRLK